MGTLLILVSFHSGWVSLVFAIIAVAINLDPFYCVFEEFLPDPHLRSLEVIVASWIARFTLGTLSVCEFTRFITILLFVIALMTLLVVSNDGK